MIFIVTFFIFSFFIFPIHISFPLFCCCSHFIRTIKKDNSFMESYPVSVIAVKSTPGTFTIIRFYIRKINHLVKR